MIALKTNTMKFIHEPKPDSGIAVDASCIGNPGPVEYKGINIFTGQTIFHQGPFQSGTNSIGEFLAVVHALEYCKSHGYTAVKIYTDSTTAIAWVTKYKKVNTTMTQNPDNVKLFEKIRWSESWLKNNSYLNQILKWDTAVWGETPADYGRKV